MWHYEYALFNMNLDRAIQSFEVVCPGFPPNLSNIGFHAPPQHPGWAHDGTEGDLGYSSTPWTFTLNGPPPVPNSALELRNFCAKPKRQRDSVGHTV